MSWFLMSHAHVPSRSASRGLVGTLVAALLLLALGTAAPVAAAVPTARIDLRVLVFDDNSPGVEALIAEMDREGIPFDAVSTSTPVTAATASTGGLLEGPTAQAPRAKYQAVVLPNAAPAGLDATELATLAAFERKFGVREVDTYLFPETSVGLVNQWTGSLDGMTAQVTAAGLAGPFGYLDGPVPVDDADTSVIESFGYLPVAVSPLPAGQSFQPLLTAPIPGTAGTQGSLVGVHTDNGRERLVVNGAFNANQRWFQVIAHGLLTWATRGVHLGYDRNYFSVNVDDVFLPDSRWSDAAKCTPGDDFCPANVTTPDIRMVPADVSRLTAWQAGQGFRLDMLFNGGGSEQWKTDHATSVDPLVTAFTAPSTASQFRWVNHTYEHPFLGCLQIAPTVSGQSWHCATSAAETPRQDPDLPGAGSGGVQYLTGDYIRAQVQKNVAWATAHGLGTHMDPAELVTGEHSGLRTNPQQPVDNPFLGPALDAEKIAWTGSDASREGTSRTVDGGRTGTVPRHPMNIFYNAATFQDEVSEYNWIYTSQANGGSGICSANPLTSTCITPLPYGTAAQARASFTSRILPLEVRIALSHVLTNDPRPHYAHQSNLAEDGILYPVVEGVLAGYRAAFADNAPIVTPTLTQAGAVITRAAAWAGARGTTTAYLDGDGLHVPDAGAPDVPVTVPTGSTLVNGSAAGLDSYGGERSGWLAGSATLTVPPTGYVTDPVPAVAPGTPGVPAATAGDRSASLTWAAPTADGGAPITSYVVTPYVAGVAQAPQDTGTSATTYTVNGLTNGVAVTFTVAARNSAGTGPASGSSGAVTPAAVPGQPTQVAAVAGNASATVSWTAPTGNGSALTGYVVTAVAGSSRTSTTTGPAATSTTVSGLVNGTSYTFVVAAVNAVGTGQPSTPSAAVVPAGVPGAPTGLKATRGNKSAGLTWSAPADNGRPITGYRVTPYLLGTVPLAPVVTSGPSTSFTVTGLANGVPYTFSVAAVNAVGTGPASARSSSVTPAAGLTVVMAPMPLLTLKKDTTFSWTVSPAGTKVTSFEVYVRRASFGGRLPSAWTLLKTVKKDSIKVKFADGETVVVAVKPIDPTGGPSVLSEPSGTVTYPKGAKGLRRSRGWTAVRNTTLLRSPALQTTRRGAAVRLPRVRQADRLALLASGGRRAGVVDVYVGGVRAWTVRLSGARAAHQVLYSKPGLQRTGKVVLRVRSTGKRVRLQGFAVLR